MIINITKKKMFLIMLLIVIVSLVIAEGEIVNQFSNEEKEVIDKMIEKQLLIDNPTNITEENLNLIKSYDELSEIIIGFEEFTGFCDGINNCCYNPRTGNRCHYKVISNFRNYTIMRSYEGETKISILDKLEKRVIDKRVKKINERDEPFLWEGREARTLGVK